MFVNSVKGVSTGIREDQMNNSKRAVVTGAVGFIGSRMCRYLLDNGWDVAAIVRPGRFPVHLDAIAGDMAHFETNGDIAGLADFFTAFQPSTVFHFAARYVADHREDDVVPLVVDNIQFGVSVLEAMRLASVPALVHAGTSWQNSRFDDVTYAPSNLYAATKQAFEDIVRYYVEAGVVRAVCLRIFDSYGEDDHRRKLLYFLMEALRSGERIGLTAGEQQIDLVHVSDICCAFETAGALLFEESVERFQPVYGISSGARISIRQLAALLEGISGRKLCALWGERPYRRGEVMRLQTGYPVLPGWRPLIPLETGLRALWDSFGRTRISE